MKIFFKIFHLQKLREVSYASEHNPEIKFADNSKLKTEFSHSNGPMARLSYGFYDRVLSQTQRTSTHRFFLVSDGAIKLRHLIVF